jgi:BMFP domain-containing protein YqiC
MQTDNRVLDSMARFFTNAAGAAQAFRTEVESIVKTRLERLVADLDFVPREEFNAVKLMASKARAENDKLAARVAALEAQLTTLRRGPAPAAKSPRPRKSPGAARKKGKL